jgi:two-component system sensor histidine kinase PhoQ
LNSSIQTRLVVLTLLLLGSFLALTAAVLERSFRVSVMSAAEDQLRLLTFSLMGQISTADSGIALPGMLPEPRLEQPGSGLQAWVIGADDRVLWASPSAQSTTIPGDDHFPLAPGQFELHGHRQPRALLHLRYPVIWETLDDAVLTFHVVADRAPFDATIAAFRNRLYLGLGIVTLAFVLAQLLAVRWALRPLRSMALQIRELEQGRRHRLGEDYPTELHPLVSNLDRFAAHEEARRRRYRRAMDDLAHSLKTPLAVLRNAVADLPPDDRPVLEEQIERMQNAVGRQLSRTAVSGPVMMGRSEALRPLVERLVRALALAFRDRELVVDIDIPPQSGVRGDERDLLEMLGNVLENAFKYAHSRIRVRARRAGMLVIEIADDGPGIPDALRDAVLQRGVRADEATVGQGIGLAAAADLAELYQGRLGLSASELGGLEVRIELP